MKADPGKRFYQKDLQRKKGERPNAKLPPLGQGTALRNFSSEAELKRRHPRGDVKQERREKTGSFFHISFTQLPPQKQRKPGSSGVPGDKEERNVG